ncbi:6-phosphofructokinase 1 [Butyrivibrio proteoclasticus]|uniref:Pyrophosphate--fructose 6-phosphate 1-phosphotransferase n=1 Tax=Butyrivibrio proteoclasticus TaxID=43305 RepID=A0A1I5VLU2_9FIRM|nr:6-phosphofructokinase [Butyrivibrio proteoclasticus]SFQ08423.1 6-phosphofructokinase 1 [Butyrivibrio proteoclasticus]
MNIKNVLVAQSGGPTSAINASLAGVLKATIDSVEFDRCYGAINGILGVMSENYLDLTDKAAKDPDFIKLLTHTPAMYLGSCRFKLPEYKDDDSSYSFIFSQFKKLNIGAFFYIGGNDSMDTVLKLSNYAREIGSDIKIIGVPKTIDNDLCHTDHTPGFGSAAKYIAGSILEIAHDTFIYAVKSVTIVEIMGRDAGWLTAAAALARNSYSSAPHLIYLPEVAFDKERFLTDVRNELAKRDNVIVAVSEGIRDKDGNYITSSKAMADTFGHQQLSGAGKALEFIVKENIGVKVRSVEINVLQRCAAHLASRTDLDESFAQGKKAVELAGEGQTGCMVVLNRLSNDPYQVEYSYAQIKDIANEAKSVPAEWINESGNDVKKELIEYLRPLIQGEVEQYYEDGLPKYLDISHLNRC